MKVGIAFSTKDRVELTRQSVVPLLQPDLFDLHWVDGSTTAAGEAEPWLHSEVYKVHPNIRGGADAAIVYGLSCLLDSDQNYDVVGLVENDVLLDLDWFDKVMPLFEAHNCVGAVSARCYEDRRLFQSEGYAVMHNLGAGMILLKRKAAELILNEFRTGFTDENRQMFMQVAGVDIGNFWAFKQGQHWITADWQFERILARNGYAALAVTPSACQMIGQDPPLEQQGLKLVTEYGSAENEQAIEDFFARLAKLQYASMWAFGWGPAPRFPDGGQLFFPHQLRLLKHARVGKWRLKWLQGFGPFAYKGLKGAELHVEVSGPCAFSLHKPDCFEISDERSGFNVRPKAIDGDDIVIVQVPAGVSHRTVSLKCAKDGGLFCGLWVVQPQLLVWGKGFRWAELPPVE